VAVTHLVGLVMMGSVMMGVVALVALAGPTAGGRFFT
jgi:hypothetical protein